jgi:hypothetical protein
MNDPTHITPLPPAHQCVPQSCFTSSSEDERERDVRMPNTSAPRLSAYCRVVPAERAPTTSFPIQPPKGDTFLSTSSTCTVLHSEHPAQVQPREDRSRPTRVTALASPRSPHAVHTSDRLQQSHHRLRHAPLSLPRPRPPACELSTSFQH